MNENGDGWIDGLIDRCPFVVPVAKLVTWAKHVRSPVIGPHITPHPSQPGPRGGGFAVDEIVSTMDERADESGGKGGVR